MLHSNYTSVDRSCIEYKHVLALKLQTCFIDLTNDTSRCFVSCFPTGLQLKSTRHCLLHSSILSSASSCSGRSRLATLAATEHNSDHQGWQQTAKQVPTQKEKKKIKQQRQPRRWENTFQVYELLQHSGRYCKDMYIAQTKPDNI